MSDEDLVLKLEDATVSYKAPAFSIFCCADYTEGGDEMDFRFTATTPETPNVLDWISFLFLARHKVDTLYTAGLERAIAAYLEMREDVGEEVAKMDIENYLTARVAQDYVEGNPLGLRDVEED